MMNTADITKLRELVFRYARHRGLRHHDAEDFTQDLFAKLYGKGTLERFVGLAESASHLEALVMACAKNLVIDLKRRERAAKRGGRLERVDLKESELRGSEHSPDLQLQFQEVLEVVQSTKRRLREEYHRTRRGRVFDVLQDCLTFGRGGISLDRVSLELDMKSAAVRVTICRMKSRFREMVALALAA